MIIHNGWTNESFIKIFMCHTGVADVLFDIVTCKVILKIINVTCKHFIILIIRALATWKQTSSVIWMGESSQQSVSLQTRIDSASSYDADAYIEDDFLSTLCRRMTWWP